MNPGKHVIRDNLRQAISIWSVLGAVSFITTAFWLFRWRAGLGVAGDWEVVPNQSAWPWQAWLLPLGVLLVFGGAAGLAAYDRFARAKTDKERAASTRVCIIALMLTTVCWQWAMLGPGEVAPAPKPGVQPRVTLEGRFNIIAAMWSDLSTEYFAMAYRVTDSRQFARDYVAQYQKPLSPLISHVATHPPGAVLFFYAVRRAVEGIPGLEQGTMTLAATLTGMTPAELVSSAQLLRESASISGGAEVPHPLPPSAIGAALTSAIVLSLLSVSIIPVVFWIAAAGEASLAARDARGLLAAAFFAFAPSLNLYSFTLDALIAAGVAWSLLCLTRHLEGGHPLWLGVSGALMALTTFFSIGALAGVAICCGALPLYAGKRSLKSTIFWLCGFVLGWACIWLAWPYDLPQSYQVAMDAHKGATLAHRSWLPWVFMNLVVWSLFCGWPLLLACIAGGEKGLPQLSLRSLRPGDAIGLAGLGCMLLLTVSGNVRGEVERLWLFLLAPLAVLALGRVEWQKALPLLGFQAAQTLIMAATLAPLVRPI